MANKLGYFNPLFYHGISECVFKGKFQYGLCKTV